jgi:DNA polymerase-3 subunit delta
MSFQTFLHEIEKDLPSRVYLLYASDPFLHREALESIKKLVPEEERDFNLHIFDLSSLKEDNLSFEMILNVANTVSFFGSRRLTVVGGNIQKLSKKDHKRLDAYISNPAPNSTLIMLHDGVLKKDMRDRFKGVKSISLDIREAEITYWIKQRVGLKGLEISDAAADYLIGLIGPDMGLLSSEVEKISLLGEKRIDIGDISEITAGGRTYSIFDLVEALREKDAEKVFKVYKTLSETADDYSIIGAMNWQYGRNLVSDVSPTDNEYFFRLFDALNRADIDIKSSGRAYPMEYLLVKLLRLQEGRSPSW